MSKEQRLSQILANRDTVKATTNSHFTELQKTVKAANLFQGQSKVYKKKDEDGEELPEQNIRVQKRVPDLLEDLEKICTSQFDAVASVDVGNQIAKADVIVNGSLLLKDVPVTTLLSLEKDMKQVRATVLDLPVLDPAYDWTKDEVAGLYKTGTMLTNRTSKVVKPLLLAPATDKHPAQTQTITVDETVGQWLTTNASGAIPLSEKKKLLERCDVMISSLQSAREEANSIKLSPVSVGKPIFDFILG